MVKISITHDAKLDKLACMMQLRFKTSQKDLLACMLELFCETNTLGTVALTKVGIVSARCGLVKDGVTLTIKLPVAYINKSIVQVFKFLATITLDKGQSEIAGEGDYDKMYKDLRDTEVEIYGKCASYEKALSTKQKVLNDAIKKIEPKSRKSFTGSSKLITKSFEFKLELTPANKVEVCALLAKCRCCMHITFPTSSKLEISMFTDPIGMLAYLSRWSTGNANMYLSNYLSKPGDLTKTYEFDMLSVGCDDKLSVKEFAKRSKLGAAIVHLSKQFV